MIAIIISLICPLLMAATPLSVGTKAPDFTLSGIHQGTQALNSHQGKYVVLEWFNKDCPYVKKHYDSGNMQRLQNTYTGKGVVWLTIVSSAPGKQGYLTKEEAKKVYGEKKSGSTDLLLDPAGKVGRLYGAKTTPHMFIINPEGLLVYNGAIDDTASTDAEDIPKSKNYVTLALTEVLAGKPVSHSQTKPYGCSVKY